MKFQPRYELNFFLDDEIADDVLASARQRIATRPECLSIRDRDYEATDGSNCPTDKTARQPQYRVRRTDRSRQVLLQRKTWDGDRSLLRQTCVSSSDTMQLSSSVIDQSWDGKWFHKKLVKHDLRPSLETQYDRTALEAETLDGVIRLSCDRNIRSRSLWAENHTTTEPTAFRTPIIMRMKFSVSLPAVFKALIYEFALLPDKPTALNEIVRYRADANAITVAAPIAFDSINEVAACSIG